MTERKITRLIFLFLLSDGQGSPVAISWEL